MSKEVALQEEEWEVYVEERRMQDRASILWQETKGADEKVIAQRNVACLMNKGKIIRGNFKRKIHVAKYQKVVADRIGVEGEGIGGCIISPKSFYATSENLPVGELTWIPVFVCTIIQQTDKQTTSED